MAPEQSEGALDRLRIVEVGEGKAVAYAGKLLRDLGADIVKIEPPEGDRLRLHGPFPGDRPDPERHNDERHDPEQSGQFIYYNGGKRGARLDLSQAAGRSALESLLGGADALIHAFRPAEARALGLDRERLLEAHPRLVVTAVTTFGHSGPYAEWKGEPLLAYCGAGVAYRIGDPEREPLTAPLDGADVQHAGVHAALTTLLALHHRDRIGRGQFVDVSALEVVNVGVWGHGVGQCVYLGNPIPQRNGRLLSGGLWGVYAVKDGDFALITQVERQWLAFLEAMGEPEWAQETLIRRLATPGVRRNLTIEQGEHVYRVMREGMGAQLMEMTKAELWELTKRERVAFLPVLTIPELCESDQAQERGLLVDAPGEHPPLRVPGAPYRLSRTPWAPPQPPPRLDQPGATGWEASEWPDARPGAWRGGDAERAPLAGLRVLDFGQVWAGPLVSRYLADYGADVVKVQTTKRAWSSGVPGSVNPEEPLSWEWILRNRRSITLDLKEPEGLALFERLCGAVDVVVDNYAPRVMPSLGVDYERLVEEHSQLIMLAMPAAGRSGPWANLVSYGPSLTGLFGMKSLNGYPEDRLVMEEAAELDPIASAYGTLAILAALASRSRTGRGQFIELGQGEAGFAGLAEAVIEHTWNGRDLGPVGNTHRFLAPHGIYPCSGDDQWIGIACGSEQEWTALARAAGHGEWLNRAEFATRERRGEARTELDRAIGEWTGGHDKRRLAEELQAQGVAAFPVLDATEVIADPHLAERRQNFVLNEAFPAGELLNGNPWHLSEARPRLRLPAPAFGAHIVEVLGDYLWMPAAVVRRLEEAGVLE